MCAHCKKIRNDQKYWQSLEKYFGEHLDLEFSHGICPDCAQKLYPEFVKDRRLYPAPESPNFLTPKR